MRLETRLLLLLLTVLAANAVASPDGGRTPFPQIPPGKGEQCVEPTDVMRRRHGEILLETATSENQIPGHDLAACVDCHVQRSEHGSYIPIDAEGQFCQSCHEYAAVSLNCFDCHADQPEDAADERLSAASKLTADHSQFDALKQDFASAPEVTEACLSCHTESAKQLQQTQHWLWVFPNPQTGQLLGKRHTVNMFWGGIATNEAACTSCHIGYGWKDSEFDFSSERNVDCLVCHDTTGTYKKFPTDAGSPPYQDKDYPAGSGHIWQAPDLGRVARNVGKSSRENCGACHFYGGGGDGVKHGDLDSSLNSPSRSLDVHMGSDGLDFSCGTCHVSEGHHFSGSRYAPRARDPHGIDVPGRDDHSRATCESCHGDTPHRANPHGPDVFDKLNEHTDRVACPTCHIPEFARGGVATKTWADWSTVGKRGPDGEPLRIENDAGRVTYATETGDSAWAENLIPEYSWYGGKVQYQLLGAKLDPESPVAINEFQGRYEDPDARIWPFKVMRGKQPYDAGNDTLAIAHMFGDDDAALWQSYDWNKAIEVAMKAAGADYSGEFGFIETTMQWPLAHMVAPRESALVCNDCHRKDGRLEQLDGFYVPGRDRNALVDRLGWLLVITVLAAVLLHGIGRLISSTIRRKG